MHLVFADPPYAKNPDSPDLAARLLLSEKLPLHLAPDALLVLEVREGWRLPPTSFWQLRERRKYGSTEILLLNPSSP
jgi:16S rRNA G966 N2-methylase RsmD